MGTSEIETIRRVKAWIRAVEEHGWKGRDYSAPSGVAKKWMGRLLNAIPGEDDPEDIADLKDRLDAGSLHASREPAELDRDAALRREGLEDQAPGEK